MASSAPWLSGFNIAHAVGGALDKLKLKERELDRLVSTFSSQESLSSASSDDIAAEFCRIDEKRQGMYAVPTTLLAEVLLAVLPAVGHPSYEALTIKALLSKLRDMLSRKDDSQYGGHIKRMVDVLCARQKAAVAEERHFRDVYAASLREMELEVNEARAAERDSAFSVRQLRARIQDLEAKCDAHESNTAASREENNVLRRQAAHLSSLASQYRSMADRAEYSVTFDPAQSPRAPYGNGQWSPHASGFYSPARAQHMSPDTLPLELLMPYATKQGPPAAPGDSTHFVSRGCGYLPGSHGRMPFESPSDAHSSQGPFSEMPVTQRDATHSIDGNGGYSAVYSNAVRSDHRSTRDVAAGSSVEAATMNIRTAPVEVGPLEALSNPPQPSNGITHATMVPAGNTTLHVKQATTGGNRSATELPSGTFLPVLPHPSSSAPEVISPTAMTPSPSAREILQAALDKNAQLSPSKPAPEDTSVANSISGEEDPSSEATEDSFVANHREGQDIESSERPSIEVLEASLEQMGESLVAETCRISAAHRQSILSGRGRRQRSPTTSPNMFNESSDGGDGESYVNSSDGAIVPDGVSKKQWQQHANVVNEIIQTEEDYVRDLDMILTHFVAPLRESLAISSDEHAQVFGNLEEIAGVSLDLLETIAASIGEDDVWPGGGLARAFSDLADTGSFEVYEMYIKNHTIALDHLRQLLLRPDFAKEVKTIEKQHCRGLCLADYILKPIQRITKYPLLFRELKKGTPENIPEHVVISEVAVAMEAVADRINEKERLSARQLELNVLLTEMPSEVNLAGHSLLAEGDFYHLPQGKGKPLSLHFFLFDNILLFTKTVMKGGLLSKRHMRYAVKRHVDISSLSIAEVLPTVATTAGTMYVFDIFVKHEQLRVGCEQKADRDRFITLLQDLVRSSRRRSLSDMSPVVSSTRRRSTIDPVSLASAQGTLSGIGHLRQFPSPSLDTLRELDSEAVAFSEDDRPPPSSPASAAPPVLSVAQRLAMGSPANRRNYSLSRLVAPPNAARGRRHKRSPSAPTTGLIERDITPPNPALQALNTSVSAPSPLKGDPSVPFKDTTPSPQKNSLLSSLSLVDEGGNDTSSEMELEPDGRKGVNKSLSQEGESVGNSGTIAMRTSPTFVKGTPGDFLRGVESAEGNLEGSISGWGDSHLSWRSERAHTAVEHVERMPFHMDSVGEAADEDATSVGSGSLLQDSAADDGTVSLVGGP